MRESKRLDGPLVLDVQPVVGLDDVRAWDGDVVGKVEPNPILIWVEGKAEE